MYIYIYKCVLWSNYVFWGSPPAAINPFLALTSRRQPTNIRLYIILFTNYVINYGKLVKPTSPLGLGGLARGSVRSTAFFNIFCFQPSGGAITHPPYPSQGALTPANLDPPNRQSDLWTKTQ